MFLAMGMMNNSNDEFGFRYIRFSITKVCLLSQYFQAYTYCACFYIMRDVKILLKNTRTVLRTFLLMIPAY